MEKTIVSRINVSMRDGEQYGVPCVEGRADELLAMATGIVHQALQQSPKSRLMFARNAWMILHDTRPAWVNRLVFDVLGVGVIFALVYAVGNGLVLIGRAVGLW